TDNEILHHTDRAREGPLKIDESVAGLVDEEGEDYARSGVTSDDDDDGPAGGMSSNQIEFLSHNSLQKLQIVREWSDQMRDAFETEGYGSPAYQEAQETILNELMGVRFTAKMVERLADAMRLQVREVRSHERAIMQTCVDRAGMPRTHFIKTFPGNETNLDWVLDEVAAGHPYSATLERYVPDVQEIQKKLIELQRSVVLPLKDLKDVNKRMATGEAKARKAKRE